MITREQWAKRFLTEFGAPIHKRNLWALVSWMQAEGGDAKFNPLNTTQKMPGSTDFNWVPVQNYTSYAQGINASVKTIKQNQKGYDRIRKALNDPDGLAIEVLDAVEASAWGTGGLAIECLYWVKRYWDNYRKKPINQ